MPKHGAADALTRRMTAQLDAAASPREQLAAAIDYLRAAAARADRRPGEPAALSDLLVVFVATQVWAAASLIGRAQTPPDLPRPTGAST